MKESINETHFKQLKNGQTIEVENKDLKEFLKYIELTNPNFSFKFKINHKIKEFTTLKKQ